MISIPSHIRALIFDCDGTLADTMPLHYRAWSRAFALHGREFPEEAFYAMAGIPAFKIIETFNRTHGYALPEDLFAIKEGMFMELIAEVKAIEPVVNVVLTHSGKLPMAVATGGLRHICVKTLEHIGVAHHFDAIVTADEVPNGKPAPDVFLEAARRVGVTPKNCLAFEDGDPGIVSAKAAGMAVVDVRPFLT